MHLYVYCNSKWNVYLDFVQGRILSQLDKCMQTNSNVGRHLHRKISLLKDTGVLINILSQLDWTHSGPKTSKHRHQTHCCASRAGERAKKTEDAKCFVQVMMLRGFKWKKQTDVNDLKYWHYICLKTRTTIGYERGKH